MPKTQIVGNQQVEKAVLDLLEKTSTAVSCDYVANNLNIAWGSARTLLLDMALNKKLEAEKTTNGLIFRLLKRTCEDCAHSVRGTCQKGYDNKSKSPCREFILRAT